MLTILLQLNSSHLQILNEVVHNTEFFLNALSGYELWISASIVCSTHQSIYSIGGMVVSIAASQKRKNFRSQSWVKHKAIYTWVLWLEY